MAVNTLRNSTNVNVNGAPTVTIVDSVDKNDRMATCCFCVPEVVGVFAILLMNVFFGIFSAAASFVSLGYASDVSDKIMLGVSGSLYTFIAITSALGVSAIRKEKIVLMRRLSIAFWILATLMFIFNIVNFILDYKSAPSTIQECVDNFPLQEPQDNLSADCKHLVNASITGEGIRVFITGIISMYFAYVVFKFTRQMKKEVIPFTIAPAVPKTPTYFVSTQPPTSNNWVPPPTYTVHPSQPLPEDFNPDAKIPIN